MMIYKSLYQDEVEAIADAVATMFAAHDDILNDLVDRLGNEREEAMLALHRIFFEPNPAFTKGDRIAILKTAIDKEERLRATPNVIRASFKKD